MRLTRRGQAALFTLTALAAGLLAWPFLRLVFELTLLIGL